MAARTRASTPEPTPAPAAAVLGAVLAELRDLRHRLRTTPTTALVALAHVEAILMIAEQLEGEPIELDAWRSTSTPGM
jgi:hypothetical protein